MRRGGARAWRIGGGSSIGSQPWILVSPKQKQTRHVRHKARNTLVRTANDTYSTQPESHMAPPAHSREYVGVHRPTAENTHSQKHLRHHLLTAVNTCGSSGPPPKMHTHPALVAHSQKQIWHHRLAAVHTCDSTGPQPKMHTARNTAHSRGYLCLPARNTYVRTYLRTYVRHLQHTARNMYGSIGSQP